MPFDAAILGYVEDALSEAFEYHQSLDAFLTRSGISPETLARARTAAETRAAGRFSRAPKRFVVQELMAELHREGVTADRFISNLITGLTRGRFERATATAQEAIKNLRSQIDIDQTAKRTAQQEREKQAEQQAAVEARRREARRAAIENRRDTLRASLISLSTNSDAQSRGYLLEGFLTDLLELEGLQPRGSFRVVGEQIDGSFQWRGGTHLTEAKWITDKVGGAEFGAFLFKIEGKTADTRGLYVAVNGYSKTAIDALIGKGALRFVCIDGAHLMRALEPGWTLARVLEVVWRHADETGRAYLPIAEFPT